MWCLIHIRNLHVSAQSIKFLFQIRMKYSQKHICLQEIYFYYSEGQIQKKFSPKYLHLCIDTISLSCIIQVGNQIKNVLHISCSFFLLPIFPKESSCILNPGKQNVKRVEIKEQKKNNYELAKYQPSCKKKKKSEGKQQFLCVPEGKLFYSFC